MSESASEASADSNDGNKGTVYAELNRDLRSVCGAPQDRANVVVSMWRPLVVPLLSCIDKLPKWSGTVYRGRREPAAEILKEYRLRRHEMLTRGTLPHACMPLHARTHARAHGVIYDVCVHARTRYACTLGGTSQQGSALSTYAHTQGALPKQ